MEAIEAAKAERRAAEAALNAVEGGIDFYAKNKDYDKLREIAEASAVATKVPFLTHTNMRPQMYASLHGCLCRDLKERHHLGTSCKRPKL